VPAAVVVRPAHIKKPTFEVVKLLVEYEHLAISTYANRVRATLEDGREVVVEPYSSRLVKIVTPRGERLERWVKVVARSPADIVEVKRRHNSELEVEVVVRALYVL
jgi:hypothetical protein